MIVFDMNGECVDCGREPKDCRCADQAEIDRLKAEVARQSAAQVILDRQIGDARSEVERLRIEVARQKCDMVYQTNLTVKEHAEVERLRALCAEALAYINRDGRGVGYDKNCDCEKCSLRTRLDAASRGD